MPKIPESTGRECHDCRHSGPGWSSINHGVLLCDECCSVHLSLGRHISQIKSLKRSYWPSTQLNLINELSITGANLIWEYSLRDPHSKVPRKKPSANDALLVKADFIRAKYQQQAYINRLKDETTAAFEDLNLQLHSIVRTDNIITCLRFLSQGADPNFRNPETGTSSIHVAASRGQANQIELLCIFGGDPATVDALGVPPEEHARVNGFPDLANRLVELQYELTDRLICFIGGQRPDHKTNLHIHLPDFNEGLDQANRTLLARHKLQQLPNSLFEDLAMDVYDEIERRELKTIWHAQVDKALLPLHVVPFLPVNPSFSATRNQGRQKLARYGLKEFNTFIYDILKEFCRRYYPFIQQSPVLPPIKFEMSPRQNINSIAALINAFIDSEDEPFYDKVASDDDDDDDNISANTNEERKRMKRNQKLKKSRKEQQGDTLLDDSSIDTRHSHRSIDLKSRVMNTETQVRCLANAHMDLKNELSVLHQMIQRLLDESLANRVDQQVSNNTSDFIQSNETNLIINKSSQQFADNLSGKSSPFVESDYDNTTLFDIPIQYSKLPNIAQPTVYVYDKRHSRSLQRFPQIDEYPLENLRSYQSTDFLTQKPDILIFKSATTSSHPLPRQATPITIYRSRSCSGGRKKIISPPILTRKGSCNHIGVETDINKSTRKITYRVAELFTLIQENQSHRYVTYAQRIHQSVRDMLQLSERMGFNADIRANLDLLNISTQQLLTHAISREKHPSMPIHLIIDDCYGIALATRNLLSLYQKT